MGKKICIVAMFVVCFFLIISVLFFYNNKLQKIDLSQNKISSELDSAVSFIIKEYEQNEIFGTFLCKEDLFDCKPSQFSFFISEAILNSILEIERNEMLDEILKKEVERTSSCQNEQLFWDFYCKNDPNEEFYYPDLDSTALASWFLSSQNIEHRLSEIKNQIKKTQFYNGALLTFLRDFQPPPHAMNQDPVANANALVLLSEEIPSVCEYINNNFDKSIYYTDDVVLFYMLSKAYSRGAKCLSPALGKLYKRIKSSDLLKKNKHPMHLAMFVTALIKFDNTDIKVLNVAIKSLFETEWDLPFREHFFRTGLNKKRDFYYSPAFSAAVYAEALTNIKSYLSK